MGQAAEYNKYLYYTKQSATLLKEESKQTGLPFIQKQVKCGQHCIRSDGQKNTIQYRRLKTEAELKHDSANVSDTAFSVRNKTHTESRNDNIPQCITSNEFVRG